MSDLFKSYALRNAEQLTPRQVSAVGIQTHPPRLRSDRFVGWERLCEAGQYREVEAGMRRFHAGEEALRSVAQLPPVLRRPLEFAEYHGYRFTLEEFVPHLDARELAKEFGEFDADGRYPAYTGFHNAYTNVADQLLAEAKVPGLKFKSAVEDKQSFLKTLRLIERVQAERRGRFDLNVGRLYAKPLILPRCLMDMDPCRDVTHLAAAGQALRAEPGAAAGGAPARERDRCECRCNTDCVPQNRCCARITPYVADLFVVRDKVSCYEVGEMSYIENVIESEIRVRRHRTLEKEEFLAEQTRESAFSEEKDHQVDEKFSLQTEVAKSVEQELSLDAGVTFNYKWGLNSLTATTDTGYNLSKKDAQNSVQNNSRQTIDRAVSKLESRLRDFSSRKFSRESEEINKHVFGGTAGAPADISRQFFYVTQVKEAQTFNYGRRMLLDFYLPEPSELYKHLLAKQFKLDKPEEPSVTAEEIDEKNYQGLVRAYGLKGVEAPPKMTEQVRFTISERYERPKKGKTGLKTGQTGFSVPNKYKAVYWHSDGPDINWDGGGVSIVVSLAGRDIVYVSGGTDVTSTPLPDLVGGQTVSFQAWDVLSMQLDITVECQLLPEFKLEWQSGVYAQIVEVYKKELAAYEEALAEFEKYRQRKYQQNPFILLQDIQEQLKQAAISYISCQFFDSMDAMKRRVEPCGFPQPDLQEAEREGRFVRFFEQAFEWKFMNFIFYPSFWAAKCTWEDKFKEEADNMLFQRFLKAGYARVSVSVREGFEGHVGYFLKTKQIWGQAGQPPIAGADFVPIYQEIQEDKDNFYTDRPGRLDVLNGSAAVTLHGNDQYWDYGDPLATPFPIPAGVDANAVAADADREITIRGKLYRIVSVQLLTAPDSWTITLERPYEGDDGTGLPWSTGALFVGAPWEFRIPTRLVWLRERGGCLPCYPIECEE